ncbi:hypothetical protein MMEU_2818 [Mycobacterium marinum str. Europe]|nr:hypothetical protein MMEU_2818 [Mycobacterium marinum str. Europe]
MASIRFPSQLPLSAATFAVELATAALCAPRPAGLVLWCGEVKGVNALAAAEVVE